MATPTARTGLGGSSPATEGGSSPATEGGESPVRIVFASGGTGGHVVPALAVAEALIERSPASELLFIGAKGGIEENIVPRAGYRLELLDSVKPPSGLLSMGIHAPVLLWRMLSARKRARKIMTEFGAQAVVGCGGYASAAPLWAASRMKLPAMLLEQNAIPGKTNRFVSRWASEVHTQFAESVSYFDDRSKVKVTGNPVPRRVREVRRISRDGVQRGLLVTGGSQGAQALNELMAGALPKIAEAMPGLEYMHLSGREGAREIMAAFEASALAGEVHESTSEMEYFYGRADLVLARAGATTIAELTAVGLPSVLVPYPYAADDHQRANGRALVEAGAAVMLDQDGLSPEALADTLIVLMKDKDRLAAMAEASRKLGRPDAAERIAERICELALSSAPPPS